MILIPIIFMWIGVFLSQFDQNYQSQSKVLSVDQYPMKQSVLFNEFAVSNTSDVTPSVLAENLPMYDDAFDIHYSDANVNQTSFLEFSKAVYDFGTDDVKQEPYHYGSYEIYEADKEKQKYKFINYINLTS